MSARALPRLPDLIAQRGNVAEFPENTLPALRSALELGARHVEFDVQFSADRQPVVLNDSNLQRVAGVDRNVLDMTLHELAEVPVTEPDRLQRKQTDIGIPTLVQTAGLLSTHPAVTAFVEIKRASLRAFGAEIVVRKICEVLRPIVSQCVLVSADLTAIHQVRRLSSFRIGWMLSEYSSLSALKSEALVPEYLLCDQQLLTQANSQLWRGPWRWAIYNVTTKEAAADVAARGARLVATLAFRKMLREYKAA
ncbi:MAG: glycerophosphodiester phosphodiesterase family protein [Steroidobacter sp.]